MISCTEFILAYNEMFNYLHEKHGKEAVVDLWKYISDEFLQNLDELVAKKGIQGMKEYWSRTLEEEGADYEIKATEDEFVIEMYKCPSVGILRRTKHIKVYPYYCEHCKVLYSRVVEKYGFDYNLEIIDTNAGRCRLTIRKKR